MSNHDHLTLTDVHGVLPDFMGWLNSQLAKRIKRLRRWNEVVWEPNVHYSAVALQGEAEALDKVVYTLLNPASAGLVQRPMIAFGECQSQTQVVREPFRTRSLPFR